VERSQVVLVDRTGRVLGAAGKLDAHRSPGQLHLAFSVFVFRPDGTTLLQRRSRGKYHFPGFWANTCCSHPEPGEELVASAARRLKEELGLTCQLETAGTFLYEATDPDSGLVERELDTVLVGEIGTDVEPEPDPDEVDAFVFLPASELQAAVEVGSLGGAGPLAPWVGEALGIAMGHRGDG
jgi:isopentenyl-diphosphate delta-isomerase